MVPLYNKKIEDASRIVGEYLVRNNALRDPMEASGGSRAFVARMLQGIADMETNIGTIRVAIHDANRSNSLEVVGQTRSAEEWLILKREILPKRLKNLKGYYNRILSSRMTTRLDKSKQVDSAEPDLVVNLDENELVKQITAIEEFMAVIDMKLSLFNATVVIEVP